MIKALVSDFSRTLLTPSDKEYSGGLNSLYESVRFDTEFDFWQYFKLNVQLLEFYKTLQSKLILALFTTGYVQEDPALAETLEAVFSQVFSGSQLGVRKQDVRSYQLIAQKLELSPSEILYIDDKQANVDAAQQAGMSVIRFESEKQAITAIMRVLESAQ